MKQPESGDDEGIEVTREMCLAGASVLDVDAEVLASDTLAEQVYIAMERARLSQTVPLPQSPTREALNWSVNKIRTDPLTFLLSVYVAGFLPAWITSCVLAYANGTDLNILGICFNAFFDAAFWPLKVVGF